MSDKAMNNESSVKYMNLIENVGFIDIIFLSFSFECMKHIQDDRADIMALDTGQGYFAGRYYNMMPIMAEKYTAETCTSL